MRGRKFLIPTATALTLTTTTGCEEAVVDVWYLESMGEVTFPSYVQGTYCEYKYEAWLSVSEDMSGEALFRTLTKCGESVDATSASYLMLDLDAWPEEDQRRYGIVLSDSGSEYAISLDCGVSKGVLTCEDQTGTSWMFEKADTVPRLWANSHGISP